MVDVARVTLPEQVRGRAFATGRSGGIRVLQPEDELPLQVQRAVISWTTTSRRIGKPASDARLSGSRKTCHPGQGGCQKILKTSEH